MTTGKKLLVFLGLGTALFASACSSSGSSSPKATLLTASQDLGVDPTGQTTVLTFSRALPATLTPGEFATNGAQLPTMVSVAGSVATVQWDSRVTPTHEVQTVGSKSLLPASIAVTTTDAAAPTFVISAGTQSGGALGGDTFSVQFSGANVVEATAEDITNWDLSIGGTSLDLTGSTFAFDPGTQSMAVTLGATANLHASFNLAGTSVLSVADVVVGGPVAGVAAGDAIAPTLLSIEQNLSESEFGFVVDFTFDEWMDPALNTLGAFDPGFPVYATQIEQPTQGLLRVTFTAPIIPGQDTIDLSGVVDAAGNALPNATVAVAAPSVVANSYVGGAPTVSSVANIGGDTVVAQFVQAIDPDAASLPASWDLESPPGNDIDLTNATFDYDLLSKMLTITLVDDDLVNADGFSFGPSGTPPLDVDGEAFATTVAGAIGGDVAVPTVASITQNRVLDPTGATFDIALSEDVDEVQAEMIGNYVVSNGAGVSSANLLGNSDTVRLVLDTQTLPGEHTIDVMNLVDLAGNAMGVLAANAVGSTDGNVPVSLSEVAFAVAGLDNDTITVQFDDDMVVSEVTDPSNWIFQSPVGLLVDTTLASVAWNSSSKTATLTFDGGDDINLKRDEAFELDLVTMRDISGNVVSATTLAGSVDGETGFPTISSVWVETANANNLHVRFDEPVELFSDALTSYVIRDAGGLDIGGGPPTVVVDADGLGAKLTWAAGAVAGTHTLDVRGVTDVAGNQMFPVELHPIVSEVAAEPALDAAMQKYLAVSGEKNDTIAIVFDQPVSPWNLLDPAKYTLTNGSESADFANATMTFDGDATVSVVLEGPAPLNFDNGGYTLTVDDVLSAQGIEMTGASMDTAVSDAGTDVTAAAPTASRTRIDATSPTDSILIEMDEAFDGTEAITVSNYAISAVNPDTVLAIGPRTVRATWSGGVSAGQMVDITVADLAGNSGLVTEAIQTVDIAGPTVVGVSGTATPGIGGDFVTVAFSEPVGALALLAANYTVSSGGVTFDISSATLRYSSVGNTVTIVLPDAIDLVETDTINVMVSGVTNHAGLTMAAANVNGAIGGDSTPPAFVEAFANYRADAAGRTVDIRFSEDVDEGFATDPYMYTSLGGQSILGAVMIRPDTVRLTLASALSGGDLIEVTGLPDMASNVSATIQIEPIL